VGPLVGSVLQARSLEGVSYVATLGTVAVAMHASRLVAYGFGGAVDAAQVLNGMIIAITIMVENLFGEQARRWMGSLAPERTQLAALVVTASTALAMMGA